MVLASYGPGEKFNNAEKLSLKNNKSVATTEFENAVASQN
jgi:ferrous iron transport protein B